MSLDELQAAVIILDHARTYLYDRRSGSNQWDRADSQAQRIIRGCLALTQALYDVEFIWWQERDNG